MDLRRTTYGPGYVDMWSLDEIRIRIRNLKKILPDAEIDFAIHIHSCITTDECELLHLAYYYLKSKFCKIERSNWGKVNSVYVKPKLATIYANDFNKCENKYYPLGSEVNVWSQSPVVERVYAQTFASEIVGQQASIDNYNFDYTFNNANATLDGLCDFNPSNFGTYFESLQSY